MKTVTTRTIEVEDVTYKCDFCEHTIECRHGMRARPMLTCTNCKQHACHEHRTEFNEDGGDYADAYICPQCLPTFGAAWAWAIEHAERYQDLMDVVRKRMAECVHAEGKVE